MNSNLLSQITALEERLKVRNKNLYGGKSQKGINKKKREREEDHTRDKDDFDGTSQSLESSLPQHGEAHAREEDGEAKSKEVRLYHQGLSHRQVKAFQLDGYNVYMYLDNKLIDTEHFCCMAHARAKFKYALEQSNAKDAAFILELIDGLYKLERKYEESRLSPGQIRLCRNNLKP